MDCRHRVQSDGRTARQSVADLPASVGCSAMERTEAAFGQPVRRGVELTLWDVNTATSTNEQLTGERRNKVRCVSHSVTVTVRLRAKASSLSS